MIFNCEYCNSINFKSEATNNEFKLCCHKGKVKLASLKECPEIDQLFSNKHPDSSNFLSNIRSYNSALAFGAINAQIDEKLGKKGNYFYKVHGQVYHTTSRTLYDEKNTKDFKYSQLYVLESDEALNNRMNLDYNKNCDRLVNIFIFKIIKIF
jgi:hypothetical protein